MRQQDNSLNIFTCVFYVGFNQHSIAIQVPEYIIRVHGLRVFHRMDLLK